MVITMSEQYALMIDLRGTFIVQKRTKLIKEQRVLEKRMKFMGAHLCRTRDSEYARQNWVEVVEQQFKKISRNRLCPAIRI